MTVTPETMTDDQVTLSERQAEVLRILSRKTPIIGATSTHRSRWLTSVASVTPLRNANLSPWTLTVLSPSLTPARPP